MNFRGWLQKQIDREDRIGQLARFLADKEVKFSSRRRKPDEHRKWASTVTWYGNLAAVKAFNEAWEEYQEAQADVQTA